LEQTDPGIHKLLSWPIRKDYPIKVGITLPIPEQVGEDFHEIQFWEEANEPFNLTQPTKELLQWLTNRLRDRGRIPYGVPDTVESVSVRAYRDGKAAYVLFELLDSLAASINEHPVLVQIEYRWGMPESGWRRNIP
jgi:hypothetical protein